MKRTFDEDKVLLELQQKVLGAIAFSFILQQGMEETIRRASDVFEEVLK